MRSDADLREYIVFEVYWNENYQTDPKGSWTAEIAVAFNDDIPSETEQFLTEEAANQWIKETSDKMLRQMKESGLYEE